MNNSSLVLLSLCVVVGCSQDWSPSCPGELVRSTDDKSCVCPAGMLPSGEEGCEPETSTSDGAVVGSDVATDAGTTDAASATDAALDAAQVSDASTADASAGDAGSVLSRMLGKWTYPNEGKSCANPVTAAIGNNGTLLFLDPPAVGAAPIETLHTVLTDGETQLVTKVPAQSDAVYTFSLNMSATQLSFTITGNPMLYVWTRCP